MTYWKKATHPFYSSSSPFLVTLCSNSAESFTQMKNKWKAETSSSSSKNEFPISRKHLTGKHVFQFTKLCNEIWVHFWREEWQQSVACILHVHRIMECLQLNSIQTFALNKFFLYLLCAGAKVEKWLWWNWCALIIYLQSTRHIVAFFMMKIRRDKKNCDFATFDKTTKYDLLPMHLKPSSMYH